MLEDWYELYKDHLVTTSNLALNRQWRARLPVVQTGDDFITVESLEYALDLPQFPWHRLVLIACQRGDCDLMDLLCRMTKFIDLGPQLDIDYGMVVIDCASLEYVIAFEELHFVGKYSEKHFAHAAKKGRRDLVEFFIDRGDRSVQFVYGAAEHSAEMLQFVFTLLPEHKVPSPKLSIYSGASTACQWLHQQKQHCALTQAGLLLLLRQAIKSNRLIVKDLLPLIWTNWPFPPNDPVFMTCSAEAASASFVMLQIVSQYIQPNAETVFSAARAGAKDSLLWLLSRCDTSKAWLGAAGHSLEMLKFVAQLSLPKAEDLFFNNLATQPPLVYNLQTVLWLERCFSQKLDYGAILYGSIEHARPKTIHHVRTKATLATWHLEMALETNNLVQIQWLADHGCPRQDFLSVLIEADCKLATWKMAHRYRLFTLPKTTLDNVLSQEINDWIFQENLCSSE